MDAEWLTRLLESVKSGEISTHEALIRLRGFPYEDLDYARLDSHRGLRKGFPEVVFCPGKTEEQVVQIVERIHAREGRVLAARASQSVAAAVCAAFPDAVHYAAARMVFLGTPAPRSGRGTVVVVSAGNEGSRSWQIITAPADARDILAVGNVNSSGIKNPTSSTGPSADGRIKPDVAALGTGVAVVRGNGTIGFISGTSLAAPIATSLAAGLIQKFPGAKASDIVRAIKMGASQSGTPDNLIGYGIISYTGSRNQLQSMLAEPRLQVYPNPVTNGRISIISTNPAAIPAASFQVLLSTGQVIFSGTLEFTQQNPAASLSFNQLTAGLYFLRLAWPAGATVVKIMNP